MATTTTNSQLFIVELAEPFERLEIQFVPEEISIPRKADLSKISIIGRNNKLLQYTGGEETMTLNLEFYSDEKDRFDVIQKVDWLKSLCYNDGYNAGARKVKVLFGDLFTYHVWTVEGVTPNLSHFDDVASWLPIRAKVEVNFVCDPDDNLLLRQVRRKRKLTRFEALNNTDEFQAPGNNFNTPQF